MGITKLLWKGAKTLAILAAGSAIGHYATLDREYQVRRTGHGEFLRVESLDRAYAITRVENEIYLGSSGHNMQGVQAVAWFEGQQSGQPKIEELETRVTELEKEALVKDIMLKADRVMGYVNQGWQNLKVNVSGE